MSLKFECNFCKYNLTVSEALEPWAEGVMEAHTARIHMKEIQALQEKETKSDA